MGLYMTRRPVIPVLLLLSACGGTAPDPIAIRFVDVFDREAVDGAPTKIRESGASTEWNFKDASTTLDWKGANGVSGLSLREGRLSGRTTNDFPVIHVARTEGLDDAGLLHSIEVRIRASEGADLSTLTRGEGDLDFKKIVADGKEMPWRLKTPVLAGDRFNTLILHPTGATKMADIHHVLIRPTDVAGAEFEIESVRLTSRKDHLARVPSGVGWQGLSEIYRETLVSRAPETMTFNVSLPQNPWLDLHVGSLDDAPVTFEMRLAKAGGDPAEGKPLLRRTVTTPHRWERSPIDLAEYAGQDVTLSFSVDVDEEGTLGFWGNPVIRDRGRASPAATVRPSIPLGDQARVSEAPQGVILMMADTLRKDHLDAYGYKRDTAPTLARLAAEGVLFRDNVSQATWTKVATPSIMTSLYPTAHRVRDFSDRLSASAITLAEVYRDAGYATVSYSSVLFTGKFTNLHQGFEELHERGSIPGGPSSKTARQYTDRLVDWLDQHRDVPFFVFLHVFDPHDPFEPYRPYDSLWADPAKKEEHEANRKKVQEVIEDPLMKRFEMPNRAELVKAGIDPDQFIGRDIDWYDGSIRAMDAEVNRLLERLDSLGLDDKTLFAFVSDHGEEFLDHGRTFHGQTVYSELTNVPLLFYRRGALPGGLAIDETVQSIDLMPTLLELSHLPVPEGLQGRSLLPLIASAGSPPDASASSLAWETRPAISERAYTTTPGAPPPLKTEAFALVLDGWKLIHNTRGREGWREFELYNRADDRLDLKDVAAEHPDIVKKLAAELETWRASVVKAQLPASDSAEGLSQEELERLRSLGYVQ